MSLKEQKSLTVLVLLSIFLTCGCNDKQVDTKVLLEKVNKLTKQQINKDDVNLFMADIDGIPWILASISNGSDDAKSFNLDLVGFNLFTVTNKKTGEDIVYMGGMIKMPKQEGEGFIQIAPNTHCMITSNLPPVEFQLEKLTTNEILKKYNIHHILYGEVEPFTDEE